MTKTKALMQHLGRLLAQNAMQVFGDYESKLKFGAISRAQYGFRLFNAARRPITISRTLVSATRGVNKFGERTF
jgi:hypothetical protein